MSNAGLTSFPVANKRVPKLPPSGHAERFNIALEPLYRSRRSTIAALEEAAAKRTFHRFLDLPPELRERVYWFTFSYSDHAYHLQQPAVSRVSRLVRTESLPIFYKTNRFGVNIRRGNDGLHTGYYRSGLLPRQTIVELWPTWVSQEHIALMRYFEIILYGERGEKVRVKVDLPSLSGKKPLHIRVWSIVPVKTMTEGNMQQCQAQSETQMRPVLERMIKKPGVGYFGTREVQQMALSVSQLVLFKDKDDRILFKF
ncbi:hypothetical protein LTR56_019527 [Elasticomyces elasticus]|nr:hypothetical protein LTR56_019527 [Elasticomyces elasticus]KAK3653738.1 hypothetical protein LTR22_011116 [Elasticomyces elasticus]KAK4924154.1 hypothetical protein LTR49_008674 [Elasticomyces elasticus]KAK5758502.1 hypothetical protein LTS12_011365 [Elasticomyces elasticus]